MLRSLFSQKNIVKNIAVFLVVFGVVFFGRGTTVLAGDSTYNNYKYLWVGTTDDDTPVNSSTLTNQIVPSGTTAPSISGIVYNKPLSLGSSGIVDFSFGMSLVVNDLVQQNSFQGYQKPPSWFWDRVSELESDALVLRVCDITDNTYKINDALWQKDHCHFNKVKFAKTLNRTNANNVLEYPFGATFDPGSGTTTPKNSQKIPTYRTTLNPGWYKINNDLKTSAIDTGYNFPLNTKLRADFWYCGGPANAYSNNGDTTQAEDGRAGNALADEPLIAKFPGLCSDAAHYRIGAPIVFSTPATREAAALEITGTGTAAANGGGGNTAAQSSSDYQNNAKKSNLPECSLGIGPFGTTRIVGCFARAVFYVIYTPLSWIAGFFGMLFDFFLGYSTSDESYRYGFVNDAWVIIRDLSNIFFIIILVYTGFATVFGVKSVSMKSVVPGLIINALLINFSLLGTRVVIDLSNVVSRVFYSQIKVCADNTNPCTSFKTNGTGGYTPVSEGIVASFNPQKVFENKNFTISEDSGAETTGDATFDTHSSAVNANFNKTLSADEYAGYFIVIALFASFIMLALIKIFWSMSFMLLGRVVGLYVGMIFSPFAILSRGNMPLVGGLKQLKYDDWIKDVTAYALMAPIFIFFLYVVYGFMQKISSFVNIDNIDGTTPNFLTSVLSICIPMAIVYMFIEYGVGIAKKYGGTIGAMIQEKFNSIGGAAIGSAAGLATGGLALAGSRFGGRIAEGISKGSVGRWATNNASNNRFARMANNGLKNMQTGSWDLRNTKAAGWAGKATGSLGIKSKDVATGNLAAVGAGLSKLTGRGNILDFTTKRTEGGIKGQMKRRVKEAGEQMDNSIDFAHLSDDEAKTVLAQRQAKMAEERVVKGVAAKDVVYQTAQTAIETANATVEATTKTLEANKKMLKEQKANMSSDARIALKESIETDTKKIKEQKKLIAEQKALQEKKIQEVKASDYKNSATYDADLKTEMEEQQKADKKKYGNVKTGAQLTQLMRIEQREEALKNSLFFKNGEPRQGMWAVGGGAGGTVGALGGIYGSIGLGAMASEGMKFEQEAMTKMLQGTKKMKALSNIDKLEQAVADVDEQIEKHLIDHAVETLQRAQKAAQLPPLNDDEAKNRAKAQVKNYAEDEKNAKLTDHADNLRFEYDIANENYKKMRDEFKKPNTTITKEKLQDEHKKMSQAKQAFESAEKVTTEKEKRQQALDKAKRDEENKKK